VERVHAARMIVGQTLRLPIIDPASEALALQFQRFQQIPQRISWSIQLKHQQTCSARCFPVALRIIPDVQNLVGIQIH
jgi:hypothetical protein